MAQEIEINYYNSFLITGGTALGTTLSTSSSVGPSPGQWHVEEARIFGEFNGTSVDFGARAYATDDEYGPRRRSNAMMYSGIYNSKTKVNKTNEYPIGAAITRAVDLSHGSIQKLHAEETNLNIFQENKVSRALIDKDAIFTAEGGNLTVSGMKVIGQVAAYTGKYGISKNPESFAVFGNRKYFTDKNRGVIMRLSGGAGGGQGLTPISNAGMKNYFRDLLKITDKAYGMYDEVHDQYIVSLQGATINEGKKSKTTKPQIDTANTGFATISYSEKANGWVSLYSYKPLFGTSVANNFYTFNTQFIFKHYVGSLAGQYNNFYSAVYSDPSYVKFIMNDAAGSIKSFLTFYYEGSTGWALESGQAENVVRSGVTYTSQEEKVYKIPKSGVTILGADNRPINAGFELKESKYYKELRQDEPYLSSAFNSGFNPNMFNTTTGIKGYFAEFELQYYEPNNISGQEKAELFAVGNEINISS